jgi:replicative DNA helicase
VSGADVLAGCRDDVLSGTPPILYPVGKGLESVQVGPGLVTLLGGAPGAGKTALVVQWVVDALRATNALRGVVCNVEMSPQVLLERQLARLSGIDLSVIRHRKLGEEHGDRLAKAFATLEPLCERLCFVRPPFDLENIAVTADAFDADLLVLDYIQRIKPPGEHNDKRGSVDALMDRLRQFADAGRAIIAVAAVGRTKDSRGRSSYDANGLGLASFRESSGIEYGADSAYLLCPAKQGGDDVLLRCLKDRNGEPRDVALEFNRKTQRFAVSKFVKAPEQGPMAVARAAWAKTPPAKESNQ